MPLTEADYRWVQQLCPICGREPDTFLGVRGGSTHRSGQGVAAEIWRCEHCCLVFPDPMPIPKNGVGQHYSMAPDEYFVLHDPLQKAANCEQTISEVEALVPKGRLLDVGSGRGELASIARRRGWDVTCLEPSPVFAKALRDKGINVSEEQVENLKAPEGSFDVVILAAVLEHLYNPSEVMAAISALLRPGGILYFDIPNEAGLFFRIGNLYNTLRRSGATVNISPTFSPFHVFGYSKKAAIRLLAKHRLSAIRVHVYAGAIPLPKRKGLRGRLESAGVNSVKLVSVLTRQGAHMDVWAKKSY